MDAARKALEALEEAGKAASEGPRDPATGGNVARSDSDVKKALREAADAMEQETFEITVRGKEGQSEQSLHECFVRGTAQACAGWLRARAASEGGAL